MKMGKKCVQNSVMNCVSTPRPRFGKRLVLAGPGRVCQERHMIHYIIQIFSTLIPILYWDYQTPILMLIKQHHSASGAGGSHSVCGGVGVLLCTCATDAAAAAAAAIMIVVVAAAVMIPPERRKGGAVLRRRRVPAVRHSPPGACARAPRDRVVPLSSVLHERARAPRDRVVALSLN